MISKPADFNPIINHLYQKEPILIATIDQELTFENTQFSCYVGLAALNYNRAIIALNNSNENQANALLNMCNFPQRKNKTYSLGQILKTRGDILKQFGKFLEPVLPAPACYLARFDFKAMENFCSTKSEPVMRHLRGIYPVINTSQIPVLQFLPYYEYFQNGEDNLLVGNRNWQLARRVRSQYYDKRIKPLCPSFEQCSDQYIKGLRLTYIMILNRQDQMEEYINFLKSSYSEENENAKNYREAIHRLIFWKTNYFSLIREGLDLFLAGDNENEREIELLDQSGTGGAGYGLDSVLLKSINELVNIPLKTERQQLFSDNYGSSYLWILNFIQKGITSTYSNKEDQKKLKLLLLSLVYSTLKIILPQGGPNQLEIAEQLGKSMIDFSEPEEEPFIRVFYSDKDIKQLFKYGQCTNMPTFYEYDPQMMKQIAIICLKNNEDRHITNKTTLSVLNHLEQLEYLTNSRIVGIKDREQGPSGTDILDILLEYKKQYIKQLSAVIKTNAKDTFQLYLKNWTNYYECINNGITPKNIMSLLDGFQINKPKKERSISINLSGPLQRLDTSFQILSKFLDKLVALNEQLDKNRGKNQNSKSKIKCRQELGEYLKILFNQTFLNVLERIEQEQQKSKNHEDLANGIWSEWSKANFITGDLDIEVQTPIEEEDEDSDQMGGQQGYMGQGYDEIDLSD